MSAAQSNVSEPVYVAAPAANDDLDLGDEAGGDGAHACPVLDRGDHVELAIYLLERIEGDGPEPVHDEGSLYRFAGESGLWAVVGEAEQSKIVQSFAGTPINRSGKPLSVKLNDVKGSIKLAGDRVARHGFFAEAPKGLTFRNGFVRVTAAGVTLQDHAPENRARYGYPFDFDRGVPRKWLAFLESLFRDDDDRAERIDFVQEFFGASLVGIAPTYAKCLVAVGAGENGKSRLGEIIAAAFWQVTSNVYGMFAKLTGCGRSSSRRMPDLIMAVDPGGHLIGAGTAGFVPPSATLAGMPATCVTSSSPTRGGPSPTS